MTVSTFVHRRTITVRGVVLQCVSFPLLKKIAGTRVCCMAVCSVCERVCVCVSVCACERETAKTRWRGRERERERERERNSHTSAHGSLCVNEFACMYVHIICHQLRELALW